MTPDIVERLRELALAATPGPWKTDEPCQVWSDAGGDYVAITDWGDPFKRDIEADARFIAAANPQAILALLDEITSLRKRLEDAERERDEAYERANGAERFIAMRGYRRCDIPACNCDSWHGGHADDRLREVREALEDAGVETNGRTLLAAIRALAKGEKQQPQKTGD